MPKIARVVDFETSGLPEDEGAEILEVGFIDIDLTQEGFPLIEGSAYQSLCKPMGPIPPEVSAIHHLVAADFENAPPRVDSYKALAAGLTDDDVYVAHNAKFEMFFYSDRPQRWVDTWKCALRAWPDAPGHSNQVLRYCLGLELDDPLLAMPPHRAFPDAYTTAHIMQRLLALRPIERLIEISNEPGFLQKFTFGKHYGKSFKEVASIDQGYLDWIVNKSDLDEHVKFTAKWHLQKRASQQMEHAS